MKNDLALEGLWDHEVSGSLPHGCEPQPLENAGATRTGDVNARIVPAKDRGCLRCLSSLASLCSRETFHFHVALHY